MLSLSAEDLYLCQENEISIACIAAAIHLIQSAGIATMNRRRVPQFNCREQKSSIEWSYFATRYPSHRMSVSDMTVAKTHVGHRKRIEISQHPKETDDEFMPRRVHFVFPADIPAMINAHFVVVRNSIARMG